MFQLFTKQTDLFKLLTFLCVFVKIYYLQTVRGFPDSGRKYAVFEDKSLESLPIQLDDKYGKAQSFVASIYNPKPVVDSIQEYEKYGNDGSQHNKIGNAIVNGYEAFSNFVNKAAEVIKYFTNYIFLQNSEYAEIPFRVYYLVIPFKIFVATFRQQLSWHYQEMSLEENQLFMYRNACE